MKIVVIYRPNSEHARRVEEFTHQYTQRYPDTRMELLNIDGREGSATANIYDITRYPAILALQNDGSASQVWQGDQLPLMDEVAGYARK